MILNLSEAPNDPIERLLWLSGVREAVTDELEAEFARTYYTARLQGRLQAAILAGPYAKKRVLAFTRHENQKRGRTVRWGDRADPTSSAYRTG